MTTRTALVAYLEDLSRDATAHPDAVENPTSAGMIESTAAWAEGMEYFCAARGIELAELNPWQVAAMLFSAGLVYE